MNKSTWTPAKLGRGSHWFEARDPVTCITAPDGRLLCWQDKGDWRLRARLRRRLVWAVWQVRILLRWLPSEPTRTLG